MDKRTRAALDAATEEMTKAALRAALDLQTALHEIAPIVGEIHAETAEEAYRVALETSGVDLGGIDPSMFRAMCRLLDPDGKFKKPNPAMDAGPRFASRFPHAARIRVL